MSGRVISIVAVFALTAGMASAAISYGNLNGVTVVYQQITEESSTDIGVALFGTPGIANDSLTFSPTSFAANAVNGGFDLTDGTLTAKINSIGSNVINKIGFAERGDYTLGGNGTAATNVSVGASLFIRVTDTDIGGTITPVTYNVNLTFSPSDGTFNLVDDRGITVIWNGSIMVDIDAMLASKGVAGHATKADISLDNSLMAFSEPGTVAYIKKKQLEGVTITTYTPEPATLALLACGGLALLRRRSA